MKKKSTRKRTTTPGNRTRARRHAATSAVQFLETPMATASSPSLSPESTVFGNTTIKRRNTKAKAAAVSPSSPALFAPPSHPPTSLGSISDLKDMASSRLEEIKRHVDRSHVVIVKELDASNSRIHKRFKIQNQECQKVFDEAEKEFKKMSDRINGSQEAMMTTFAEFIAEAQASTSHLCKTSIPKLSQSFEKSIDALRTRYGMSSA